MNIYQKMSSNGWHIDTPKGCGKEEREEMESGTAGQSSRTAKTQRLREEKTSVRDRRGDGQESD